MPYLRCLTDRLESLNTFLATRALRCYQREILTTGQLTLPSPWTGREVSVDGCFVANISPLGFGNIVIAYRLPCERTLWLFCGVVCEGFPLHALWCPATDETLWDMLPGEFASYAPLRQALREIAASLPAAGGAAVTEQPGLLLGHPNFAHFIWNELPGLFALCSMQTAPPADAEILLLCEPLAALEEVPVVAGMPVSRVHALAPLLGWHARLLCRVGATRISRSLRRQLVTAARRNLNAGPVVSLGSRLKDCWPVIWLSLRNDARTACNQEDFIVALVEQVACSYPRAGFILDGFNYPDDFSSPIYTQSGVAGMSNDFAAPGIDKATSLAQSLSARERDISRFIRALGDRLAASGRPLASTSGLRMSEAIALASMADYYVCHAGTLQHKIGWIYNTPGIIHSNTEGIHPAAARWVVNQVEGGVEPALVEQKLVEDLDSIRTFARVPRNRDYRFTDVAAVVRQVLADMSRQLVPPARLGSAGKTVLQ
ncbi:MAG: hypothetical protein ACK5HY_11060 [Parahaliea sp.]